MDNNSVELIIAKKKDSSAIFFNFLIIFAGIVICYFLYRAAGGPAMWTVAPFIMIAVIFIVRWLVIQSRIEYEYVLSSGTLNIDIIINQTKRKPVINTPIAKINEFGKLTEQSARKANINDKNIIICGNTDEDDDAYYFTCQNANKGINMFVFNPNAKMLNILSKYKYSIKSQTIV